MRQLLSILVLLATTVLACSPGLAAEGKAKDSLKVKVLCDKHYKIVAPKDVATELGRYHIRAVQPVGAKSLHITEELALELKGKKLGYTSTVVYADGPENAPVKADAKTTFEGKPCMTGEVKFRDETMSYSCRGLLNLRGGDKIEPPKEYKKTDLPKPGGALVFQSALPVLGPRILPMQGEKEIVWVEFPDDLAAPELINFKKGHRLVRTAPDAEGRYFIRAFGPNSDKPVSNVEFDKADNLVSFPGFSKWKLVEAPSKKP